MSHQESNGDERLTGESWAKEDGDVALDDVFEALANDRRRFVIYQLGSMDSDGETTLNKLSKGLAFVEIDDLEDLSQIKTYQRKRYYISLYQTHLPKLHDLGLIRFDKRSGVVRPTPVTQEVRRSMLDLTNGLAQSGVVR